MAEIYEINSDKFTQVEPTGEEEIQIGANKKTTLQAIADLHKDEGGLDLESPIAGFTPLETGGTQMDYTFSLLQALQMLYRIGGNGSIKMVGDGNNKFGLVSIGDNTLAGILFNTSNNTLYIRDNTPVVNAKQVTDLEIINWITEGTQVVLGATPTVNPADIKMTGFTPLETGGTQMDYTFSLLQALQMLYRIGGNGSIKMVGDGNNKFGLVSIGDNTLAGILFNTSNNTLYIRDNTPVVNAKQVTDLEIINWITEGTQVVLGATPTVNPADIKMTGFTKLNTTPGTLQGFDIPSTDSLLSVIQKLFSGITNNGKIKFVSDGYEQFGIVIIDEVNERYQLVGINAQTCEIYMTYGEDFSDIFNKTDIEILRILGSHGTVIDLSKVITSVQMKRYTTVSTSSVDLSGNDSKWYSGTDLLPAVNILVNSFDGTSPEAVFVCPSRVIPRFMKSGPDASLHLHNDLPNSPSTGNQFKVYTIYLQKIGTIKHFFVNSALYDA